MAAPYVKRHTRKFIKSSQPLNSKKPPSSTFRMRLSRCMSRQGVRPKGWKRKKGDGLQDGSQKTVGCKPDRPVFAKAEAGAQFSVFLEIQLCGRAGQNWNLKWITFNSKKVPLGFKILRGEKLNYKSVAKEISKPPFFGSWSPVGIKVCLVCLIHVSFKSFQPRPYLICHVTTIENV